MGKISSNRHVRVHSDGVNNILDKESGIHFMDPTLSASWVGKDFVASVYTKDANLGKMFFFFAKRNAWLRNDEYLYAVCSTILATPNVDGWIDDNFHVINIHKAK